MLDLRLAEGSSINIPNKIDLWENELDFVLVDVLVL